MKRANTSASNITRRYLCPGSARMEEGLAETDTEYSEEGVMLHRLFLTGQRPPHLTQEQIETLDLADFYAQEFFGNLRQRFSVPLEAEFIDEREPTLILLDNEGHELFPGHADVIRTWPKYAVRGIVDAKFGFMEVDHAADNMQLASYACARHQQADAGGTGVAIVQPRNFGPRFTQAVYLPEQITLAVQALAHIVRKSEEQDAPLVAGEKQCHFCKAKTVCPEYKAKFMGIEVAGQTAVELVSNEDLERLHVAISYAKKLGETVSAEMRKRIELGLLPGWKLQNAGDQTALNDPLGFYNTLRGYFPDLTPAQFDDCREMKWTELYSLIMDLGKLGRKKAEEAVKEISSPFVSRVPIAKRVVRDKSATPKLV